MNYRANSIGSFLQTVHSGKPALPAFDREASAKLVLQYLSSNKGPVTRAQAGIALGLDQDKVQEVVAYLHDAGMIEKLDSDRVMLSSFGDDALGVFAVS